MTNRLEPEQRSLLADVRSRPRTLDQYYATRVLLALDGGLPIERIARIFALPTGKVQQWSMNFRKYGIEYVIALGSLSPPRSGRRPRIRPIRPEPQSQRDARAMRQIQESAPRMSDLVRMAEHPSAEGADLEADPGDLVRHA
jgi:hypothetical protein